MWPRSFVRIRVVCACHILLSFPCLRPAAAQRWRQGFEDGVGSAKPYHKTAPSTGIELATTGSAEGAQHIRATLPGKRKLEGFSLSATGLTGARLATVTAKARGEGEVWLCLISANGWLYSPETVALDEKWQELRLSKVLTARDQRLGIYFISKTVQRQAVFEVDDVKVSLAPALRLFASPVGPWRFEAEGFAASRWVAGDSTASGQRCVSDGAYVIVDGFPFPRTTRPVTVYVRVTPGSSERVCRLFTRYGGNRQTLAQVTLGKGDDWRWVHFAPLVAGEVGDSFGIDLRGKAKGGKKAALDALVLATDSSLDQGELGAAPLLLSDAPLCLASFTSTPPSIDGKSDDLCWQKTVACTGFLQVGSQAPAAADTVARFCYDATRFYLYLSCTAPILDVAMQRRHEFRAAVTERDADVHRDDSCLLLIDPVGGGGKLFDFTVNALGTVADAVCHAPDYWESRDTSWDSGAVAAGHIEDGRWAAEIAIPFADLGCPSPEPGSHWRIVLGRIARARRETSSWNPSERGFHDPQKFGTIVFSKAAPDVLLDVPSSPQIGSNDLVVRERAGQVKHDGLCVFTRLTTATGTRHKVNVFADPNRGPNLASRFTVEAEGQLTLQHGILDAGSLRPLYFTPVLRRSVRSSIATLRLTCDGPYEVYLDGSRLQYGREATDSTVKVPLRRGPNTVALKLENGSAAVRLSLPTETRSSIRWKLNGADTPDALLPTTDDVRWETAGVISGAGTDSPVVGRPGTPIVLRHTLLWEKTRVWPTPAPALYVARGSAQHVTFIVDGLPKRTLSTWSVFLAVPEPFEVLGATGYYGNVEYLPTYECQQLGVQEVGGRRMRVARITPDKPVVH